MPYPIPDGGIMEVSIRGRMYGQVCLSVFHYRLANTLGVPDGDAVINNFNLEFNDATDFVGAYAAATSHDMSIDQVIYQWIYPIRYHRQVKVPTGGAVQQLADGIAANIAASITKLSDKATRHSRGSLHMPGVPETFVEFGLLTTEGKTAYDGLLPFLTHKYLTDTLEPVLFNRNQPADSEVITSARTEDTSRVNRRRTVGVGE